MQLRSAVGSFAHYYKFTEIQGWTRHGESHHLAVKTIDKVGNRVFAPRTHGSGLRGTLRKLPGE